MDAQEKADLHSTFNTNVERPGAYSGVTGGVLEREREREGG